MKIEITLEKLSGHAKDGICGEFLVKEGDSVKTGDILFQVESGKGVSDVASPGSGVIQKILVGEGDKIALGQVVAVMEGEKGESEDKGSAGSFSYSIGPAKPVDRELECDIAVLGGGPGGYVAAIQAAKMGAKVVLVEKDSLGGTCLNRGCIPTKAMIRSAEVYHEIKNAENYGLSAGHSPVDISLIVNRKNEVVKQLVQGISYLLDQNKVTVLKGFGSLKEANRLYVEERQYNTTVNASSIILATGSSSCLLPIPGMDSPDVFTSTEALSLEELPQRMAIIGGGIIGMEFAFLFARLGVEITVVEYFGDILSVFDGDIISTITESAGKLGIKLITGAAVKGILPNESGGCIVHYQKEEKEKYDLFEKVLVAVGRTPCYDGLELEKNGISLNEPKKGIQVDDTLKTTADNVYAIGDITNKIQLAHVASHQGVVAVKNIMGEKCAMDYSIVPSAVFTAPEFAMVGISEKDAEAQKIEYKKSVFPFAANGKALASGEKEGFVKLIEDCHNHSIIGAAIVGPHATDMIGEVTLAIKNGLSAEAIAETIHAHPTCAEAIHEAALGLGLGFIHS